MRTVPFRIQPAVHPVPGQRFQHPERLCVCWRGCRGCVPGSSSLPEDAFGHVSLKGHGYTGISPTLIPERREEPRQPERHVRVRWGRFLVQLCAAERELDGALGIGRDRPVRRRDERICQTGGLDRWPTSAMRSTCENLLGRRTLAPSKFASSVVNNIYGAPSGNYLVFSRRRPSAHRAVSRQQSWRSTTHGGTVYKVASMPERGRAGHDAERTSSARLRFDIGVNGTVDAVEAPPRPTQPDMRAHCLLLPPCPPLRPQTMPVWGMSRRPRVTARLPSGPPR